MTWRKSAYKQRLLRTKSLQHASVIEKDVKTLEQLYLYKVVLTAKHVRLSEVVLCLQVIQPIGTGFVRRFSWTRALPLGLDLKVLLAEMTRQILLWTISAFQLAVTRYICVSLPRLVTSGLHEFQCRIAKRAERAARFLEEKRRCEGHEATKSRELLRELNKQDEGSFWTSIHNFTTVLSRLSSG